MTKPKQSESSMRERKREQNRLSQKCLRERRLLQTRQAASVKEAIRSATNGSDEDRAQQISKLTSQLLEATQQNKRLSEALLRMRKKFLSIGTASNMAGEDDIFNDLLGKPASKRNTSEPQEEDRATSRNDSTPPTPSPRRKSTSNSYSNTNPNLATSVGDGALTQLHGPSGGQLYRESGGGLNTIVTTAEVYNSHLNPHRDHTHESMLHGLEGYFENNIPIHHNEVWFTDQPTDIRKEFDEEVHDGFNLFQHESHMPFGLDAFLAPLHPMVDTRLILSALSHYRFQGCGVFTESVEQTCVTYAVQLSGIGSTDDDTTLLPNRSKGNHFLNAVSAQRMPEKVVDELLKVAVYLIAIFAKMELFLYCLGADRVLESILRWRFLPTRKNAYAIPAPFSPTALQAFGPGHHVMIDCCVWPSLRDQLILHTGRYDMDDLSADMMHLTVLEIPYLKAAASVLDLLLTDVLPQEQSNSTSTESSPEHVGLHDPRITELSIHSIRPIEPVEPVEPVDRSLLNEIYRRLTSDMIPEINPDKIPKRSVLAPHFGLNNFQNWRLSSEFGKKYPFFDCTLAESQYPTISASTVLTVGLWVLSP